MERIQVIPTDLPHTIRGLTVYYYDEDGQIYYTILINARLSNEMQCAVFDHELRHIDGGDFSKMIPVEDLEAAKHGMYAV